MTDILPILTLPIALLAISVVHASKTQKNEEIRRISSIFYYYNAIFMDDSQEKAHNGDGLNHLFPVFFLIILTETGN